MYAAYAIVFAAFAANSTLIVDIKLSCASVLDTLPRSAASEFGTASDMGFLARVWAAASAAIQDGVDRNEPITGLDSLYAQAPERTGWALVQLASDDIRITERDASFLSAQYRRVSGDVGPVLERGVAEQVGPRRWSVLLAGVREPIDTRYLKAVECLKYEFSSLDQWLESSPESRSRAMDGLRQEINMVLRALARFTEGS